jgi:DNA-binding XRE family transcriptional regulator
MPSVYVFSAPLNWLDWDPTYPKNPQTLSEYIRKYRKDKGLLIRELAEELGIHEFTLIKWEGGRTPRYQKQMRALRDGIPGVERFLTSDLNHD